MADFHQLNAMKYHPRKKLISDALFYAVVVGWQILLAINYFTFGRVYNFDKKIFLIVFVVAVVPVAIWSIMVDHRHVKQTGRPL